MPTSHSATVNSLRTDSASEPEFVFKSLLDLPPADGRIRGTVVVNGSLAREIDNSHPQTHRGPANSDINRVEAFLETRGNRGGAWHFDFAESPGFQGGSIRVESGDVRTVTSTSIIFGIDAGDGPIRFTFLVDEEGERRVR